MNYLRYIASVSVVALISSCGMYDDLEITKDLMLKGDYPLLVMNSQMDANMDVHTIRLYTSTADKIRTVDGPDMTVRINGNPVDWYTEDECVRFNAELNSGDVVTIDAAHDGLSVSSEVTVPGVAEIISCDTEIVDHTLICRFTLKDRPGEKNYYRVGADFECTYHYTHRNGRVTDEMEMDRNIQVETYNDPIINSGYSSETLDDFSIFMPENKWKIFSDEEFADGTVTLRVDIPVSGYDYTAYRLWVNGSTYYDGPDGRWETHDNTDISSDIILKVYSMSEVQYNYLKAVTIWDNFNYEIHPLAEPSIVPSNVNGGLGVVAVDNPALYRLKGVLGAY